jgi:hypothetical protein
MARRPEPDERFLVPACSGPLRERVYVTELAKYLGIHIRILRKYARRHRLLHYATRGTGVEPIAYVTEHGAMRLISFARVVQGKVYAAGKDFHAINEATVASVRAYKARKKARLEAEAATLAIKRALVVGRGDGEQ